MENILTNNQLLDKFKEVFNDDYDEKVKEAIEIINDVVSKKNRMLLEVCQSKKDMIIPIEAETASGNRYKTTIGLKKLATIMINCEYPLLFTISHEPDFHMIKEIAYSIGFEYVILPDYMICDFFRSCHYDEDTN